MGSVIIIQEWTPGKSISKKSFPTKGAILAQSLRWILSKQRAACDGISKIVKLVLNTLNVTLIFSLTVLFWRRQPDSFLEYYEGWSKGLSFGYNLGYHQRTKIYLMTISWSPVEKKYSCLYQKSSSTLKAST
jgi:hypothetical protein